MSKKAVSKSGKGGGNIPRRIKYELVDELRGTYPVSWLLEIAYIKPASYYKWKKTNVKRKEKAKDEQVIREHIWGIHFMHPEFGRPRITDELNENGYLINHKKVYRLMTEMDIQSV
ncbi:IS3 family transposase, partial [Cytobacillus oceanisediminis]|uniref:IS3 family transposase n=1 Tax=Cytobacillus oceanisediminis TaxID=665099 RepID=UPI0035BC3360